MRIFGKNVYPRQVVIFGCGVLVLAATSYDVHRSMKNNQEPPSEEQLRALQEYINAVRRPPSSVSPSIVVVGASSTSATSQPANEPRV